MASPLLETKFHVPGGRAVGRPSEAERAAEPRRGGGADARVGPGRVRQDDAAGGVAGDRSAGGRSVAWLSLDQRDNDPALFWTYLVTALKTAVHGVGASALSLLQPPQPPIEAVLATLLNDLDAIPDDVVLVLDDYHVIEARDVQDGMAFLLEHLPPQIHLVIAGRADPALPLARLRGRGELVEIRAADLRFTPIEAAAYLNEVMGLALTAPDVAALEERTEGWIAALQLAALSMQGREDVAAFIAGFAGDDRYIVDYLAEEVLQRQPEDVQQFLLQTSILDRLSGPLCDAVTGQDGGKAKLAALERGNLFLVPLDDRRRWYRYHQLFADVLQARLLDEQPATFPACTGGRAPGTSTTASRPRPSATRWPQGISSGRRTWSSWRSRTCAGAGRRPRSMAGSRRFPTTWSGSGPYSASGLPGRCWPGASSTALRPGCGTPSGGWTPRQVSGRDRQSHRRRWSSSMTRNSAASRR